MISSINILLLDLNIIPLAIVSILVGELKSKIVKVDHGMNGYDQTGVNKFLEIIKSF